MSYFRYLLLLVLLLLLLHLGYQMHANWSGVTANVFMKYEMNEIYLNGSHCVVSNFRLAICSVCK